MCRKRKKEEEGIELNAGKNENQKQEKEEYGEGSFSAGMKISSHLEKRIRLSLTRSSSSSTLATYSIRNSSNAALVYHRRLACLLSIHFVSFLFFFFSLFFLLFSPHSCCFKYCFSKKHFLALSSLSNICPSYILILKQIL